MGNCQACTFAREEPQQQIQTNCARLMMPEHDSQQLSSSKRRRPQNNQISSIKTTESRNISSHKKSRIYTGSRPQERDQARQRAFRHEYEPQANKESMDKENLDPGANKNQTVLDSKQSKFSRFSIQTEQINQIGQNNENQATETRIIKPLQSQNNFQSNNSTKWTNTVENNNTLDNSIHIPSEYSYIRSQKTQQCDGKSSQDITCRPSQLEDFIQTSNDKNVLNPGTSNALHINEPQSDIHCGVQQNTEDDNQFDFNLSKDDGEQFQDEPQVDQLKSAY